MRKSDPQGIYMLWTKPLSYRSGIKKLKDIKVPGDARELVGFVVIPSFISQVWWKYYGSRVLTIDMAHCTGQFRGHQVSSVSRNGYNENVKTSYGYFPRENKCAWNLYTQCLKYGLDGIALLISDKTKGKLVVQKTSLL